MIELFPQYLETIRAEALESYPYEAVWLITKKRCIKVKNTHEKPAEYFSVSPVDNKKARAEGLLAVVHSHVNGLHYPSEDDMKGQVASAVPWGIVCCDGVVSSSIRWWGGRTAETLEPLEGRSFCHGTTDCYAAVRDHYRLKLGIDLPEFPRKWRWWENEGEDLIAKGFELAGFTRVIGDPQPNDVWLASFRSSKMNHCGVLLEDALTYHHPGADNPVVSSKLATIQPIYRYMPHITMWVRHEKFR